MAWVLLLLAGALEIVFAASLGASDGFTRPVPSLAVVLFGAAAVVALSRTLATIPVGTAYAVFTAIGAVGTVLVGIVARDEPLTVGRALALTVVIAGVVGLRATETGAT
ncbi:multidrug efflux SMR transporter [Iamia sp. SCSIO 61187]|uniref:DMT family transporter n=1 Tax=Iamia sp. SCSIO 61187 TaxID=2722752 RepID=UPI001C626EF0|nr:multidrug efflux SMR transporter [Iamia sp. SCSIO 61187]QYG95097.1 multidrug efflux SMR transporter [Iamia sp. SCSIO 61187]